MKKRILSCFLRVGGTLFLAGCVNLAGASISNVGNGNKAEIKTGDLNVGNGNGSPGNSGPSPGFDNGPLVRVEFNRAAYRLRRLQSETDLNDLQFDFNRLAFVSSNAYNGAINNASPSPDSQLDLGSSEGFIVSARATYEKGPTFDLGKDMLNNGDWEIELPPGVEAKKDYLSMGPFNGPQPLLLIARPAAATGSFLIRLVNQRDNKCPAATASLEVVDQGSAEVIIE